ncbi:MAG: agmatinase [Rhodospirillales bacterium]|nr:MAG: agmatinase [Rhodospirillales bacterium]
MVKKTGSDQAFTATTLHGMGGEPTYGGALSFLRRRYTRDLSGVDVAVTGVPLDLATTNRPGARFGPQAIRRASAMLSWGKPWPWGFDPFERLAVVDAGDCWFDFGRPETIAAAIERHARAILEAGSAMLTLGGDHFISEPLLRAHHARYGPLALVQFDAHSDTWADEGRRLDHGTQFLYAIEDGLIDPAGSVQVGIRTHNDADHGITVLDAAQVEAAGAAGTAREIARVVGDRPAYFSFDVDCLDPGFAPGTGTPVAGGLSTAMARAILRGLVDVPFVGMDVVEVSPPYDVADVTALAAATIALDWLCIVARQRRGRSP